MNSLYNQLNQNQIVNPSSVNNLAQIKQMINMFKGASNPQQLLMNMAKTNPQMQNVMNLIQSSGKSPKDLFYQLAQQRGVNPDEILNMLK